ncbi:MAG: HypC/HybG/HupF family hydrogenase formation chaperone [Desulfurococcaceae archaeon]
MISSLCLGSPAVVLDVDYENMTAVVDYGDGLPRKVLIGISEERIGRGDLVVVHAGVIVSRMDASDLLEQVEFFREVLGPDAENLISSYLVLLERMRSLGQG